MSSIVFHHKFKIKRKVGNNLFLCFKIKLFINLNIQKIYYYAIMSKKNILTIFLLQISLMENEIKRKSLLMSKGRMVTPLVMIHLMMNPLMNLTWF